MMQTKSLVVLAGAALGLSSIAAGQSADDSRAAARELKTDASTRSSYQNGDDPNVDFGGYTQFYYHVNHRDDVNGDDEDPENDDDLATGFRDKTKLTAEGDITEEWRVVFQGAFSTDPGDFILDDMIGIYTMDNGWSFGVGQAKLPFLAEELVKDTGQLAAGRSIMADNSVTGGLFPNDAGGFNGGRAQGVFFNYEADTFRFMGAASDGAQTANTEFTSGAEADFSITGRFEWMWAGEWDRFQDFTSFNGQENAGKVGGAIHYQDGGETFNTVDRSVLGFTADVAAEGSGWNAFGAFVYTSTDPNIGDSIDDMGIMAQGGWFVSDDWEVFARLVYLLPDDNDLNPGVAGSQDRDNFWAITGGANFYITPQSQNVKLTLQFNFFPEEQTNGVTGVPNVGTSNNSQLLFDPEGSQWTASGGLQFVF